MSCSIIGLWLIIYSVHSALSNGGFNAEFDKALILGDNPTLLACPSSFPASSGSYYGCVTSGKTNRVFYVSSGRLNLSSCTFTGCSYTQQGGCIYAEGAIMSIYSSVFTSCQVTQTSETGRGGVIYCVSGTSLNVEDSQFQSCRAGRSAGGIHFKSVTVASTITNCLFINCTAGSVGGALCHYGSSVLLTVTNSKFTSCTSSWSSGNGEGGGALEVGYGDASISHCYFESCKARGSGGAIAIFGYEHISVSVVESEIRDCSAVSNGGGGISVSIDSHSPSLTVSYLTISNCTAASSLGQAIHIYSSTSFRWDHLCITGTGTLVKSSTSSISVPTTQELTEECQTAHFTHDSMPYTGKRHCLNRFGHYVVLYAFV